MAKRRPASASTSSPLKSRNKGIVRVKVRDILPNPQNFRTHPDGQRAALDGAVETVGWYGYPDVFEHPDHPGKVMLVDGALRTDKLRRDLGPDGEVEVNLTDFSEQEARLALATKDPIAAMAGRNDERLRDLLGALGEHDKRLDGLLDTLGKSCELPREVHEDDVPEPPAVPITQPGDLWLLGDHRLLCGDSTKADDVDRLMAGAKADLCFTSPPYGQQRDYTKEGKEKCQDWDGLMRGVFANLPMTPSGQILVNLGLIHRDGEWVPYWDEWITWMRTQGWRRFGWYVWDQGFGLPGDWKGRLAPSREFVFHFNRNVRAPEKWIDKQPENIKPRNKGGSTMRGKDGKTKAFTNPAASGQPTKIPDSIIRVGRQVGSDGHPAQFPVGFAAFGVRTWPGVAYEPFCGSGTTLIAAEQLGRRCYGMEISPQYCDVIVKRWENLTGRKARRG